MKVINISIDSTFLSNLLKEAMKENIILRTAESKEFILAEINDFDREID